MIRLLTFRGRVPRDGMLLFLFFGCVAMAVLHRFLDGTAIWPGPIADPWPLAAAPWWRIAVESLWFVALMLMAVARLHDMDKRGWWALGFPALAVAAHFAGAWGLALGCLALPAWLALLVWPGTIGPNRFGDDPRGWDSQEAYDAQMARLRAEMRAYSPFGQAA